MSIVLAVGLHATTHSCRVRIPRVEPPRAAENAQQLEEELDAIGEAREALQQGEHRAQGLVRMCPAGSNNVLRLTTRCGVLWQRRVRSRSVRRSCGRSWISWQCRRASYRQRSSGCGTSSRSSRPSLLSGSKVPLRMACRASLCRARGSKSVLTSMSALLRTGCASLLESKDQRLAELQKGAATYKQYLGLAFERVGGGPRPQSADLPSRISHIASHTPLVCMPSHAPPPSSPSPTPYLVPRR